jgi:hypothetical protein
MREKERERESETSMLAASASPASAASTTTADKEPVLQRVRVNRDFFFNHSSRTDKVNVII